MYEPKKMNNLNAKVATDFFLKIKPLRKWKNLKLIMINNDFN